MTYEELMEEYLKVVSENKNLSSKNKNLAFKNQDLASENIELKVENQQLEINNLKRIIYGVKREYTPKTEVIQNGEQCSLFSDIIQTEEEFEEQLEEKVKEVFVCKNKKSKVQKASIKKEILKNVEIIVKEYDITEKESCPICNEKLKKVGKRIVRQEITYIPAKLVLTNYVQHTYKCEGSCSKEEGNYLGTFIKAKLPNPLLTHSFVSPSLAKEVIYQKYYLGVPLYRQERMWDGKGLILPRNMMANWIIKIDEYYLKNLYNLMLKKIKETNSLIHADESTIQCNKESGRSATSKPYMWVLASGELEEQKSVIFKYSPSRSAKTAEEYIAGYKGILVTDGYASYDKIDWKTN